MNVNKMAPSSPRSSIERFIVGSPCGRAASSFKGSSAVCRLDGGALTIH